MKGRDDREFRHPSEALALQFLEEQGHALLRHNYHLRFIEIDLITAAPDKRVHFIEVKHWKSADLRHPLETLTRKRKQNLQRAARTFLSELALDGHAREIFRTAAQDESDEIPVDEISVSFDLVWLRSPKQIEHFEGLF